MVGFDASTEMVRMARERVGGRAEIHHIRFENVEWREEFDGVWACASLLHVPLAEFDVVAARIAGTMRPGGAWYMSFKLGSGERFTNGRYFTDHTEETLREKFEGGLASIDEVWMSGDVRPDRGGELWLNAIALRALAE